MQRNFIPLLFLAILLSACAVATTDTPTGLPTPTPTERVGVIDVQVTETPFPENPPVVVLENDECDNPFYPVVNGAWWEYDLSNGSTTRHSMTAGDDKTFTVLVEGDNITAGLEGSCSDDGIILLDVPGNSATVSSDGGSSAMQTNNIDGVTLPNDVQVGDDWSQTIDVVVTSGDLSMTSEIEMEYKAIDFEIVNTPIGPINSLKVEQTGSTSMNGSEVMAIHGFIWYGQGVGVVKNVIDDVSEAMLTIYNIPQP